MTGKNRVMLFLDGNLTWSGAVLLGVCGVVVLLLSVAFTETKLAFAIGVVSGVLMIALASASLKSLVFGIRPFTHDPLGWRKAKKSYEVNAEKSK